MGRTLLWGCDDWFVIDQDLPIEEDLKLYKVSSSNLVAAAYDKFDEVMIVEFKNGWTYEFYDVPLARYKGLRRAKSKGKYFAKWIRDNYDYTRVS